MALGIRLRGSGVLLAAALLGSVVVVCITARSGAAQPAAAWRSFAGNSQHTGLSATAAQSLEVIHWSTPVDLGPPGGDILIHYGSPLVTPADTVIIPVKTGASGGYRVDARAAKDGALIWSTTTDYILPPHNWTPSYSPALGSDNRLYFAGAGGTVYYRDNVDGSVPAAGGQLAFVGLSAYQANRATFDATVFVNTPITTDSGGNIYFGFRTSGTPPLGLQSGIARIDAAGAGSWVSAATAARDITMTRVPHQAAPALSNDERTLYVVVAGTTNAYLVGLDPATLDLKDASPGVPMRVPLKDPRNGGTDNALVLDDSSASPMVGPDGDVYYGVLSSSNPFNGSRGWLLHFSGDLTQTKTPGAFGWDNTAAIVPASAVPPYQGASTYLIFSKYNNYAGLDGGDGVNKVAVLDPNDTQVEPHASSNGLLVMKEVLTIAGPTPDPEFVSAFPQAVREWCVNTAAVDPFTKSVMVNSEDGTLYRWDLTANSLSQAITLSSGIGEAYTPTVISPDGTVYAINHATLDAVGQRPTVSINDVNVAKGNSGTTPATFTVSLSSASAQTVTVDYATADGTATVAGNDYQSASGRLTFAPGQTSKTISVLVTGDTVNEPDETFAVNLSNPVDATIARSQGRATILNEDPLPALSVSDVSLSEGNSGSKSAVFTVTLASASTQTVAVAYATADGTATVGGNDYQSASGTLTFAPGQTTRTITVVVKGDTLNEADEAFFVDLSNPINATVTKSRGVGTILNDDGRPKLSIKNVSVTEGNSGTTPAVFTVTLTPASGLTVTVDYATADGTATAADNDYVPQSGTLTFAPGETAKTIAVAVIGDTVKERNETFFVNLGAAVNATLARAQGRGTIVKDDTR